MTRLSASLLILTTISVALSTACDADDQTAILAAEVDRLQAENDALRAALSGPRIFAPIDAEVIKTPAFREAGKPWQKYLPTAETQNTIAAIMKACGVKSITISTSGYDPDIGSSDDQVLSLGYSYMGGGKERACLDAEMDKRGAVSL